MKSLDLHNTKHENAFNIIENFIIKNYHNFPIEIITGNSTDMQKILKNIIKEHKLRVSPSHANNLGSYTVNHPLNNA